MRSTIPPSPFVQVLAGSVHAVVPRSWEAAPLPATRFPQQGFVASPNLADWERGVGTVGGMEAFWIDVDEAGIASDYYYVAARSGLLSGLGDGSACRPQKQQVYVDHPPDFTGKRFSPSDYVASASGTCRMKGQPAEWTYVVAAPGYGPIRQVGIPNSGLYVVVAVVSGPQSRAILKEMIDGARFGNASITDILQVANRVT
jgi:hypothetical protein